VDTAETVHPIKAVQLYGAKASAFTKDALSSHDVWLEFDVQPRDRYDTGGSNDGCPCYLLDEIRFAGGDVWTCFSFGKIGEKRSRSVSNISGTFQ